MTKKGPGRPRSAQSEKAILDATLELIAESGYGGLSLDKVASMAKSSKSTIYRRWPSKLHLVVAAFETIPELNIPDSGNLLDDLMAVIQEFISILSKTRLSEVLPALSGELAHNPELYSGLGPVFSKRREPIRAVLRKAIERGEVQSDLELEMMVDLVMGPVMVRLFFSSGELNHGTVKQMLTPLLQALKIPSKDHF